MPFKKRHGGHKPKGVPNKATREMRTMLQSFIDDNFDEAVKQWRAIKQPDKKLGVYLSFLRFVCPVPSNDFTSEEREKLLALLRSSSKPDTLTKAA